MTKKHFIQIAKILKNIKLQARNSVFLSDENTTNLVVNNIRKELIKMFIEVNPNFDVVDLTKIKNIQKKLKIKL